MRQIIIAGGGAAGFFSAITCAESIARARVMLFEQSPNVLAKVRVSGGGRCNVTHACFDPAALSKGYPRGGRALLGAFHRFQSKDTAAWFEARGVALKTEADGRMFPATDRSDTIIACLREAADKAGVEVRTHCGVASVKICPQGGFDVVTTDGAAHPADAVVLATGGCRAGAVVEMLKSLGHTVAPPVPSLFTFHVDAVWLRELPGVAVPDAEVSVSGTKLKERGPLLVTHTGLSGPVILRLSAWGARELHERGYQFELRIRWLPAMTREAINETLAALRHVNPNRLVVNMGPEPLPGRLWEQLALLAGMGRGTRWNQCTREQTAALAASLDDSRLAVCGKSMNKEEFVTCGGVRLNEVDFKTMQSRVCPGLFLAGELLDIDGITGGFNFQAAWTTGWIAGKSIERAPRLSVEN